MIKAIAFYGIGYITASVVVLASLSGWGVLSIGIGFVGMMGCLALEAYWK